MVAVPAACSEVTSGSSASPPFAELTDITEPAIRGVFGLELFEALLLFRFCGMALGRCINLALLTAT